MINVKTFNNKDYEMNNLNKKLKDCLDSAKSGYAQKNVVCIFNFIFCVFLNYSIFGILLYQVIAGKITIGTFIFLGEIYRSNFSMIQDISFVFGELLSGLKIFSESMKLINIDDEIKDEPNAKDIDITKGKIVFKDVDFRY